MEARAKSGNLVVVTGGSGFGGYSYGGPQIGEDRGGLEGDGGDRDYNGRLDK